MTISHPVFPLNTLVECRQVTQMRQFRPFLPNNSSQTHCPSLQQAYISDRVRKVHNSIFPLLIIVVHNYNYT